MGLRSYEKGYAVMSKDLSGYSLMSPSLETCKQYCYNNDVIVEQIPVCCGYKITVRWIKYYKKICLHKRHNEKNIFKLHWQIDKIFVHENGDIVFKNQD